MPFDPDAYLAEKEQEFDPDAYLAEKEQEFDPDAYLADGDIPDQPTWTDKTKAPPLDPREQPPTIKAPVKEFDEPEYVPESIKYEGMPRDPFATQDVSKEKIDELAEKYKVDRGEIIQLLEIGGGATKEEFEGDPLHHKAARWLVGRTSTLPLIPNLPLWVTKKMTDDPEYRQLIDEVSELAYKSAAPMEHALGGMLAGAAAPTVAKAGLSAGKAILSKVAPPVAKVTGAALRPVMKPITETMKATERVLEKFPKANKAFNTVFQNAKADAIGVLTGISTAKEDEEVSGALWGLGLTEAFIRGMPILGRVYRGTIGRTSGTRNLVEAVNNGAAVNEATDALAVAHLTNEVVTPFFQKEMVDDILKSKAPTKQAAKRQERHIAKIRQQMQDSVDILDVPTEHLRRPDIPLPGKMVEPRRKKALAPRKQLEVREKQEPKATRRARVVSMEEAREFYARSFVEDILYKTARRAKKNMPQIKVNKSRVETTRSLRTAYANGTPQEQEFIMKEMARVRALDSVDEAVRKGHLSTHKPTGGSDIDDTINYLVGGQQFAAHLDRRHGGTIEWGLHELSNDLGKFGNIKAAWGVDIREPLVRKLASSDLDLNQIVKYVENPNTTPSEYKPIVEYVQDVWKRLREESKGLGVTIGDTKNYMRRQLKRPDEFIATVDREFRDIVYAKLNKKDFATMRYEDKETDKLITFVEDMLNTKVNDSAELYAAMKMLEDPALYRKLEDVAASAAKERKGDIPEVFRETDTVRLVDSWIDGVVRMAMTRDSVSELKKQRSILQRVRDHKGAEFVQDILDDVAGKYSSKMASKLEGYKGIGKLSVAADRGMREWRINTAKEMAALEDALAMAKTPKQVKYIEHKIKMKQAERDLPQVLTKAQELMYANYLGWSFDKPIRNMTQPFVLTAQEIGGLPGQRVALEALSKSTDNFMEVMTRLQDEGKIVRRATREEVEALKNGFTKHFKWARKIGEGIDAYARKGLSMYELSDITNRVVTANMAEILAKDFKAGRKYAVDFFENKISEAYKNMPDKRKAAEEYLLGRTQFKYDRATLSQVARDLGPFMRTFSKWPVEVTSDIIDKMRVGKHREAFTKYMGPVALYSMVDAYKKDQEATPSEQVLIGKKGTLRGKEPLESVKGLKTHGIPISPHLTILSDLLSGDWKWGARQTFKTYAPVGPINQLTKALQLITNDEVKGPQDYLDEALKD